MMLNRNISRSRGQVVIFAVFGLVLYLVLGITWVVGQEPSRPTETRDPKSFGAVCDGTHDDTRALQDTIIKASTDPHAPVRVVIPNNCVSGPLKIGSNQWIEFAEGATLRALPGSFTTLTSSFLTMAGQHNVTIKGNHATLLMNRDEYRDGEWRAGVLIYQSTNVQIDNLKVVGAAGDGFTIKGVVTPDNIKLIDVAADHCARNGISIISGRNVLIQRALLTYTGPNGRGTAAHGPWAGLDVEPNGVAGEVLENIRLEDLHTISNDGAGLQFTIHSMPEVTITVSGLHSENDGRRTQAGGLYYGGILFGTGGGNPVAPVKGQILIEGTTISTPNGSGVLWSNWSANEPLIILRNTRIHNPGAQTTNINRCGLYYNVHDSSFGSKYAPGAHLNVQVDGLVVSDDNNRLIRAVWFEGDAGHPLKVTVNNVQEEGREARVQVKVR